MADCETVYSAVRKFLSLDRSLFGSLTERELYWIQRLETDGVLDELR